MRRVEEQTQGRMRLGPRTLYSSVQAMLEEGLVEEVEDRGGRPAGHERRRYYHLTPAGRKLARLEADRLAGLLRLARTKAIVRGDYV
jgi:DNA-binding PadR family transcriptional regulator